MNNEQNEKRISLILAEWYELHKRDLPWRKTRDPYKIWLSEIILQQTRVEQGLSYYLRFIASFPDIFSFARAGEDEVLKLWQGLGYYSRARNMHKTADELVSVYKGVFPKDYHVLLQLKGIGPYTAAAIASFAYDQAYPVVDGNVIRVLSRIFNIDLPIYSSRAGTLFNELAGALLDRDNPARHNQAIMEFGALQCKPGLPDCSVCPMGELCLACSLGVVYKRPVRKPAVSRKKRCFNYLCLSDGRYTWLQQRKNKDIWQNLWEFPLYETSELLEWPAMLTVLNEQLSDQPELLTNRSELTDRSERLSERSEPAALLNNKVVLCSVQDLKHILSHQFIQARFFKVQIPFKPEAWPAAWTRFELNDIDKLAVSRLTEIYLENHLNELDLNSNRIIR
ncbi:MAG: A/G-specific adenine glycosylase [Bacteroidales bacterium]|nr:A/G-specific adenine glycosylase [Bacteroidales bacterium]